MKNILLLICCLLVLSLSGCGGSRSSEPSRNQTSEKDGPSEQTSGAETIYKSKCMTCHGTDLQGRIGPGLQHVGAALTREQIIAKIQKGGGGMPTFEKMLDKSEIETLADWLSSKK